MQKLYLVGFTTDLRSLILSRQKGVKSGGFSIAIDDRLLQTVEEVVRRQDEAAARETQPIGEEIALSSEAVAGAPTGEMPARSGRSRLTPKEIQSHLREGRSVQDVARMAGTDVAWIERFVGPILAEREGIVEAVRAGTIVRPRAGRSGFTVGEAIAANLRDRKGGASSTGPHEGWTAVRRNGSWEVTFRYSVRGQAREAQFTFDTETRAVKAMTPNTAEVAWRAAEPGGTAEEAPPAPERLSPPRPPTVLTARPTRTGPPGRGAAPPAPEAEERQPVGGRPNLWGSLGSGAGSGAGSGGRPGAGSGGGRERSAGIARERSDRSGGDRSERGTRAERTAPSPQGAGPSDDRPSFARSTANSRPRRLLSGESEAEFRSAVARTRANRVGGAGQQAGSPAQRPVGGQGQGQGQGQAQGQRKPARKRLPDDWLLDT
ncbi:MAG TPA: septation protein SepH [Actinomycetota bacterium]|nr:septation protein SepH [Actinomycetota bacterium]